jgi:predicted ATPase
MGYKLQINSLISFNASQQSAKVDEESTQNILRDTIQTNSLSTLLSNQPHEKRIIFKHCSTGVDVAPQEMGIGVSQIMPPIILAATTKSDSTIAISQPELHIHPRWQAVLGDVFLSTATQDSPPLIIIETHSELLMLRILRRVRQTAEETIPDGLPPVKPEIITVYYVQNKDQGGIEVFHAAITSSGDFDQNWPDGFFYERIDEVF